MYAVYHTEIYGCIMDVTTTLRGAWAIVRRCRMHGKKCVMRVIY